MHRFLRITCAVVSCLAVLSNTACSTKTKDEETPKTHYNYTDIKLGEDCTDLKTKITVLTHRTDLIQDTNTNYELPDYVKEFNKLYPDITVTFESVTDYDFDVINRLPSGNWGDVCMIPSGIELKDMSKYFEPISSTKDLNDNYESIENKAYDGIVYGIPSECNAQGIVYNKKVWADAGIKTNPTTPDEFIKDLQLIKEKTDAIPLYTNYAAEWPLITWDYHAYSALGNANYRNDILTTKANPFSKQNNNTGIYEVYNLLYQIVAQDLTEEDPTSTSWELCKERMNSGEIGCMVLGSWAVSQIQTAGVNKDNIGYMPFPLTIDGKQYALVGSDYCYGINKNISKENKTAAMLYIKFMTEKSGYAYNNSCIPVVKNESYPEILADFKDVELLPDIPANEEFNRINTESGLDLGNNSKHIAEIIDAAKNNIEIDTIIDKWNDAWTNAQNNTKPVSSE